MLIRWPCRHSSSKDNIHRDYWSKAKCKFHRNRHLGHSNRSIRWMGCSKCWFRTRFHSVLYSSHCLMRT